MVLPIKIEEMSFYFSSSSQNLSQTQTNSFLFSLMKIYFVHDYVECVNIFQGVLFDVSWMDRT